jgi:hypothetical protein
MWNSSTTDAPGNTYIAGEFTNTVDFDPGPNTDIRTAISKDAFITKLDAAGNLVWVIQLGGTSFETIYDVDVDAQGHVYVSGYADSNVDFDPGPGVVTSAGMDFTAKYDAAGNLVWVSRASGGISLAVDANQNIYITGHTTRGVIGNPTAFSNDTYISKLNSSGVLVWQQWVGGDKEDIPWSIAVDGDGNAIVGGSFLSATLDINPGPGVYNVTRAGGDVNVFLIKLAPNGDFIWGCAMIAEYPYDIKTDAANNVYVTGFFAQTADFDPGPGTYNLTTASNTTDVFICKLTAGGQLAWAKQLASTTESFSYGKAMAIDAAGNVYTTGYMADSLDMDPGPNTAMATGGCFVSKLDTDGNYRWGKVFGGTERAQSYGIGVDAAQSVYITGYYLGTLDLDPSAAVFTVIADPLAQNIFISKLTQVVGGSLPVTWLNVEGTLNSNQQATIRWQAEESNVQVYSIEKSTDGSAFTAISTVTANGNGTHSYVFTEPAALQQTAWYRILQTDLDGRSSYSTILRIAGPAARTSVTVYPVPARNQVTISFTGNELLGTQALLIDRSGRPLKTIYLNKQQTQLPLYNLPTGLYYLQLSNGQTTPVMVAQ